MTAPSASLFDNYCDDYDAACQQGLALTGEARDYFARRRIELTADWLRALDAGPVTRLLDFGCGTGDSAAVLLEHFPLARLVGVDVSGRAIERAVRNHGQHRARFARVDEVRELPAQDLVYTNGVFHHIAPAERPAAARRLLQWLRPGGWLALWENNPWNPGTRLVMRRIPFDRDARPVDAVAGRRLLCAAGLRVVGVRFCFCFPRVLARLRWLETYLMHLPLGAQYCLLARRPRTPIQPAPV